MRSDTKPLNSVALDLLQRKNQIACPHCYDTVMGGRSRTVLDDSGTLAITAWTCTKCSRVYEEVRIMMLDRKSHLVRFGMPRRRYTQSDGPRRLHRVSSGTEVNEGW